MTYLGSDRAVRRRVRVRSRPACGRRSARSPRASRSTRSSGTCCTSTCCIRSGCGNRACCRRPGSASTTTTTRIRTTSRCCSARSTPRSRPSPCHAADRLGDRRARRRGGGVRHRPADDLLLRVHALHPAPRVQAEVELGAAHEAAPHGAPLLRRDRQLRDHQLLLGPGARHLLREEGPAAAARRRCSTSATTRKWPRSIRG